MCISQKKLRTLNYKHGRNYRNKTRQIKIAEIKQELLTSLLERFRCRIRPKGLGGGSLVLWSICMIDVLYYLPKQPNCRVYKKPMQKLNDLTNKNC